MDMIFEAGGPSPVEPAIQGTSYLSGEGSRLEALARPSSLGYEVAKRGGDVVVASAALVLGSPLLLAIALAVRLSSPGPVLFRQTRLGRGGRPFRCLKFRTMAADAEEQLRRSPELLRRFEGDFKIKDDPRVTRLGRFLRKTSLDELPQIVNVLRGEISLIGPRPVVPNELSKYGVYAEKLLSVPQGLSGYWQVFGRSDTTYSERIRMDMTYIDNRSLRMDLRLIALTLVEVVRGRGAY